MTAKTIEEIFPDRVLSAEEKDMLGLVDTLIQTRIEEAATARIQALIADMRTMRVDVDGDGIPDA